MTLSISDHQTVDADAHITEDGSNGIITFIMTDGRRVSVQMARHVLGALRD